MPVKVVDASAIAALVFGESEAVEVAARLRGAELVAPALLPFEIASVCLKKLTRHTEQREALLAAHRLFTRLDINGSSGQFVGGSEPVRAWVPVDLWITSLLPTGSTGQAGDLWTTSLLPTDPQPYRECDDRTARGAGRLV